MIHNLRYTNINRPAYLYNFAPFHSNWCCKKDSFIRICRYTFRPSHATFNTISHAHMHCKFGPHASTLYTTIQARTVHISTSLHTRYIYTVHIYTVCTTHKISESQQVLRQISDCHICTTRQQTIDNKLNPTCVLIKILGLSY